MLTQTEICNLALGNIRDTFRIQDIGEDTPQANACRLYFKINRLELLARHDWGFASRTVSLATHDTVATPGWSNRYNYPARCVVIREIITDGWVNTNPPIAYQVEVLPGDDPATSDTKTVMMNVLEPLARFTADIETTAIFSPGFDESLAWRLAAMIAMAVTGKVDRAREARETYRRIVLEAMAADLSEGFTIIEVEPKAVSVRE